MFELKIFEDRLVFWAKFRESLEISKSPFADVITFYESAPLESGKIDPWQPTVWPTAWELINNNRYCAFSVVLGYYYSLKNTDKFQNDSYSILICQDCTKGYITYLLKVNQCYLFDKQNILAHLPQNISILHEYTNHQLNK